MYELIYPSMLFLCAFSFSFAGRSSGSAIWAVGGVEKQEVDKKGENGSLCLCTIKRFSTLQRRRKDRGNVMADRFSGWPAWVLNAR